MIVVAHGDEAEGLQNTLGRAGGAQHFSHAVHGTALSLKGDLDKVALLQGFGDPQEPAGYRDGLQFTFGALAVFHLNQCCYGTAKMDTRSAPLWVRLGKVCHSKINMARGCHTR